MNYEPSSRGGLREALPAGEPHTPRVAGVVVRQKIGRTNDYQQAGERYRSIEQWERDELVGNLIAGLRQCNTDIKSRMVEHLTRCDPEYGGRVAQGLEIATEAGLAVGS